MVHKLDAQFLVLSGNEMTDIYATKDKLEVLVQLPKGTIGLGRLKENNLVYLDKPIAGWLDQNQQTTFNTTFFR